MTASHEIEQPPCVLAFDVAYVDDRAFGAGVAFSPWEAARAFAEVSVELPGVAPYAPGAFFERELPVLLALLERAKAAGVSPDALVVDGYASFAPGKPGLGGHLHDRTGLPVIGVSKTSFHGAHHREVLRGRSARPLYVTAAGLDDAVAAGRVAAMHGPHRIPTLLAEVDRASRRLALARSA